MPLPRPAPHRRHTGDPCRALPSRTWSQMNALNTMELVFSLAESMAFSKSVSASQGDSTSVRGHERIPLPPPLLPPAARRPHL